MISTSIRFLRRYTEFEERWRDCKGCNLCETRTMPVFASGAYPCDLVFIGEMPGPSEDANGLPFIGKSGKDLWRIIKQANSDLPHKFTCALTNTVCCYAGRIVQPTSTQMYACRPRLGEFLRLMRPKGIVLVGDVAQRTYQASTFKWPATKIRHPSGMARSGQDKSQQMSLASSRIASFFQHLQEEKTR